LQRPQHIKLHHWPARSVAAFHFTIKSAEHLQSSVLTSSRPDARGQVDPLGGRVL